jgi:hypothetical protein
MSTSTAQILRIALLVCAGFLALGLVLLIGGEIWNWATADDGEGANIAAGLLVLAGGGISVLGLLSCGGLLVVRGVLRRR